MNLSGLVGRVAQFFQIHARLAKENTTNILAYSDRTFCRRHVAEMFVDDYTQADRIHAYRPDLIESPPLLGDNLNTYGTKPHPHPRRAQSTTGTQIPLLNLRI